jgi:steroid delta-isomerase-like uncharacterized protein
MAVEPAAPVGSAPMSELRVALVELPADDAERARRFWEPLLGELAPRVGGEQGEGWETATAPAVGLHARGTGPGDRSSLPYFAVDEIAVTAARIEQLGGSVIHPGERWAICRDTEGNPFALAAGGEGAGKRLVRRFYEEAINQRDPDAVDRLLSPDFVHNGELRGRAGQREAVAAFLDGFSDLRNEIAMLIAEGDRVVARQHWAGTHDGPFAGVAASGRAVRFTSTAVLRIEEGLIAEAWDEVDQAGLLGQIQPDTS